MSAEANKQIIREFFEQVWNQGSEEAIDRFIAENAGGNDPDFGMGREGFKNQWRKWRGGVPPPPLPGGKKITQGGTEVAARAVGRPPNGPPPRSRPPGGGAPGGAAG